MSFQTMETAEEANESNIEEKEINQGYKIWKKNTPLLYDLLISHALEWPSLTVEWLPEKEIVNNNFSKQKILLGTHATDNQNNHIIIAEVTLPILESDIYVRNDDDIYADLDEFNPNDGLKCTPGRFNVIQYINHQGEVNRARYMPQNSFILATKTVTSQVHIFDYSKHSSRPDPSGECNPELRLLGHDSEGYGLSWNPFHQGILLSGSDDKKICLWDIAKSDSMHLQAYVTYLSHKGPIEDVNWHAKHPNVFGSVGDDKLLFIWDTRVNVTNCPILKNQQHTGQIHAISFNPTNEWLLATGSSDNQVAIIDLRCINHNLHILNGHMKDVFSVAWSPGEPGILGSCGADRRLNIWDLSRIGQSQTEEERAEGVPELLFVHGGHTAKVSELSWNSNDRYVIASVAEDNILQIWQMAEEVYDDDLERNVDHSVIETMTQSNQIIIDM